MVCAVISFDREQEINIGKKDIRNKMGKLLPIKFIITFLKVQQIIKFSNLLRKENMHDFRGLLGNIFSLKIFANYIWTLCLI
ncbi:MAG: hypothetical protein A2068_00995 [Ignavibacteria bacterium GWB2_35_6b]|nr:MAG: hypothetical protein A2068_00995 [Ignavibacteria bacterium GWB2_35_6b]